MIAMNEVVPLAQALAAGGLLGAMFFGGLWCTVILGLSSERPALWFFASTLARTGVALSGFYFVGGNNWEQWLLSLLGFVLARAVVKRLTRPADEQQNAGAPETSYAP